MSKDQRVNGDGTPHVCEFDADGRCQMHPFTREVPTSKTVTMEHEQALKWARQQNFTSVSARYAKLCAEAYDIARSADETSRDDLESQIYALLVRRGYAQHEADAIAKGPGCTLNCVQNGYPDIDCPAHGKSPVGTPSAWLVKLDDGWRYLGSTKEDAERTQHEKGGVIVPLYESSSVETLARRCVCGLAVIPNGELRIEVGPTTHRLAGPCFQTSSVEPSGPPLYRHDWETLPGLSYCGPSYRCKRCKTTCLDAHDAPLCAVRPEKATATPTQEWLDRSQGLTGLQYDEHGERLPENGTGDV